MPTRSGLQSSVFNTFRGLNRVSDKLNTNPEFFWDLLNGYLRKGAAKELGAITQRDGISKFNSAIIDTGDYGANYQIRTIFEAKWDSGSTDIIVRAGTAWGKYDNTDSFDTIDDGRTDDVIGQCVMFKNELIMVDGGTPRKMVAAGTVSDLSSDGNMPTDSDAVWVHRDKVWLNSVANPMIAYFCTTNSANGATSWTGATDAGTIDLRTVLPVGDRIRGFRTYGGLDTGLIAIICDRYTVIYQAGTNVYDFTFVQYFPTTCVSINACDYVGTDLVYPSQESLTSIISSSKNQQLDVDSLTKFVEPLYRQLVSLTSDTSHISGVFGHTLNHYYVNFPISGNHQMLVYSVDVGNVVGRYAFNKNIYSMAERQTGVLLVGSDGYVYTMNDTSATDDDGTAIEWKLSMPALYFKDPNRYKKMHDFEALVQASGNTTLSLDYWYGLTALVSDKVTKTFSISSSASLWDEALWDVSYWDTQGNQLIKTSDILGRGKLFFMELRHNTKGVIITIPWFLLRYVLEGYN